ncbi:hypothetical protein GCM10007170_17220 [Arthrobacter liuii]|uniref:Uncharacterized protein n=1 Tax=Arthrobacter liuii TaxID=1476996 RepID=A0ABQ2ARV9_9MICC|nr:hypothetical protein GCM10007170_17220 [Arthrobacter liuii]
MATLWASVEVAEADSGAEPEVAGEAAAVPDVEEPGVDEPVAVPDGAGWAVQPGLPACGPEHPASRTAAAIRDTPGTMRHTALPLMGASLAAPGPLHRPGKGCFAPKAGPLSQPLSQPPPGARPACRRRTLPAPACD